MTMRKTNFICRDCRPAVRFLHSIIIVATITTLSGFPTNLRHRHLCTMKLLSAFQSVALLRSVSFNPSSSTQLFQTMVASRAENATLTPPLESSRLSASLPPLADNSRRLYIVRHGETDWNAMGKIQGGGFDIPLNDNGREQAMAVAQELDDIPIGVVASSHLSRATETADILWKRHSRAKRTIDAGFAEMSFGEFEGVAWRSPEVDPQIRERFLTISKQVKEDLHVEYPGGGESTAQVEKRVVAALNTVLESHPDEKHVAIVSHGRTNKVLIATTALGDVTKFPQAKQSSK